MSLTSVRFITFPPYVSNDYRLGKKKKNVNSFSLSSLVTGSDRRSMPHVLVINDCRNKNRLMGMIILCHGLTSTQPTCACFLANIVD